MGEALSKMKRILPRYEHFGYHTNLCQGIMRIRIQ